MSQITRSPSYLIRNPYAYCFRLNVPKDLQPYIGKRELRWSLKTGYISVAKHRARILAVQVQNLFQEIREMVIMGDLTDHEIRQIVNEHMRKMIKASEYLRTERFPIETKAKLFPMLKRYPEHLRKYAKRDLEDCNYLNAFFYTRQMITNGEEVYVTSNLSHRKLFRELLKAQVKWSEIEQRRWSGDYSDDVEKEFPLDSDKDPNAPVPGYIDLKALLSAAGIQSPKKPSIRLSELIAKYSDENKRAGNWSSKTEIEYSSTALTLGYIHLFATHLKQNLFRSEPPSVGGAHGNTTASI